MNYHLPPGYQSRKTPTYDDDVARSGNAVVWQPDVYPAAVGAAMDADAKILVDFGCGNCDKLIPWHTKFALVGIDHPTTIDQLDRPEMDELIAVDLEHVHVECLPTHRWPDSWIICSDVVEHLRYPESLLRTIRRLIESGVAKGATLSTPDRARTYANPNLGPPRNTGHVREWTQSEFLDVLRDFDFHIDVAGWTRRNTRQPPKLSTCLIHVS